MTTKRVVVLVLLLVVAGCATPFSPERIRREITVQTGADPRGIFEFTLGPATLALARTVFVTEPTAAEAEEKAATGLRKLEFAVYDLSPGRAQSLDFTRMKVTGWESTLRRRDADTSTVLLVRGAEGDTVGDVVLATSGPRHAVYARWSGRLARRFPEAIGEAVARGGTDGIRRELLSLTEQSR